MDVLPLIEMMTFTVKSYRQSIKTVQNFSVTNMESLGAKTILF